MLLLVWTHDCRMGWVGPLAPWARWPMFAVLLACSLGLSQSVGAARVSNVSETPHNLGSQGTFAVKSDDSQAGSTNEVCVFCHTPHGANTTEGPLWNRVYSAKIYSSTDSLLYWSASMDAYPTDDRPSPSGGSKLCLSCHDGTLAVGAVTNRPGSGGYDPDSPPATTIPMTGTAADPAGSIPKGSPSLFADPDLVGETTGFTRRIGTDLANDHPISFSYSTTVAGADGELADPASTNYIVLRGKPGSPVSGQLPSGATTRDILPLIHKGDVNSTDTYKMQCTTCHDPHVTDPDLSYSIKFLRANRFQTGAPTDGGNDFSSSNDIICLACHTKKGWKESAHALSTAADEVYGVDAAEIREFPSGGLFKVWEAACLNCHDTHTVTGARRLLREGVDGATTSVTVTSGELTRVVKAGDGKAALEETCYQCHQPFGDTTQALNIADNSTVPDIKSDFSLSRHMPITTGDQSQSEEWHEISTRVDESGVGLEATDLDCDTAITTDSSCGADFIEARSRLGNSAVTNEGVTGQLANRHAECTDCHNPHRVVQSACFNGSAMASCGTPYSDWNQGAGTHVHADGHTNIASGVLRGAWGIEPEYGANTWFGAKPTNFKVKRGNPDADDSDVTQSYVTREYQVCLKCHSNYAYGDTSANDDSGKRSMPGSDEINITYAPDRPMLDCDGCTSGDLNWDDNSNVKSEPWDFDYYTNQAMEFQAPDAHTKEQGETYGSEVMYEAFDNGVVSWGQTLYSNRNHRSWHPVMRKTERTIGERANMSANAFLDPWDDVSANGIGNQTMYCTDCHGSETGTADSAPAEPAPWGPHGSGRNFILKGTWTRGTGMEAGSATSGICFKCHDQGAYRGTSSGFTSGFSSNFGSDGSDGSVGSNGHRFHREGDGIDVSALVCTWCHVAVPHGWKNKALLVNLNDVGPEVICREVDNTEYFISPACIVGQPIPPGSSIPNSSIGQDSMTLGYNNPPYYVNARLKPSSWARSGRWREGNCGGKGRMEATCDKGDAGF